ncbi:hypothetical protein [Natronosalvus rutilus]|uniref:Uncharacterized protein n=1 Tax=Natronosalvus rutilus TaxID=2953753 RepID=A0A9E7N8E8_9EURY|nr:hypothetical protein [Natronosalvus rutilus]UTF53612.1 hypothetical protein NGM29_17885 [Natronosalvus rutilus]
MVDTGDGGNQTGDLTERALESDAPLEGGSTIDRALSLAKRGASDGSLAMATGALVLWRGLRSIRRGRVRGIIPAAIGIAAVGTGVKRRRAGTEETDKSTSDEAHAAAQREDQGRETGLDASSDEFDWQDDETSSLEPAVDDESAEEAPSEADPRLDEDDAEEADLSDTAVADEVSEATGPSAEQAQPTMSIDSEVDPETGGPRPGALDGDDSSEDDSSVADADEDSEGEADTGDAMRQDETDPDASQAGDEGDVDGSDESDGVEQEE